MDEYGSFDDMAYGAMGQAVRRAMPHTEADPVGVLASLLALWSAAVQGHIRQPGSGRPAVVWSVLVGPSNLGRKGYAADTAWAALGPSLSSFLGTRRRESFKSGAAIVQSLAELEEDTAQAEGGPDGRALFYTEEMSDTLKAAGKDSDYGSILIRAWDGKAISNTVKGKDGSIVTRVPEPLLGLYAHVQPLVFRHYVKPQHAASGLYNRMLFVCVRASQTIPEATDGGSPLDELKPGKRLGKAYRWATDEPRFMRWTQSAVDRLNALRLDYQAELENTPPEVGVFIERAYEQTKRVATILSAASMEERITGRCVDAAAAFVAYADRSIRAVLAEAPQTGRTVRPLADAMREALRRAGGEMRATELHRAVGSRHPAALLRQTAADEPDMAWEERPTRSPGTVPIYFKLLSQSAAGRPSLRVVPAPLAPPARPARPSTKRPKKRTGDPYRISLRSLLD
ncbi:hypothetical protein [Streptomyces alboflavus]|uniref:hypothetical protein n=1 Tax=Streptomyces alboflavus TaxID=67267 RepID=UPI000F656C2F|nr:hypothetical protein [Streptomyces alboflavus]